ncbi:MAG: tetrahydromethanopterin S-methyltransferase subunit C [Methanomicrobiales archaeon]|nr:tetrahydromethanopterin S-methyltransferase subunit C [Methanomicrobiales archaeon]
MTVSASVGAGAIPHNTLIGVGLVGSLVGIYLTYLNVITGLQVFSFFGGIGAVLALVWGSNTIKTLCSYGIGTGVPSAGMLSFGSGVIAMLFATRYGVAAPIVGLVLAAIVGAILGYCANQIVNMKIPVMIQSITEMAAIGALTIMGYTAMAAGSFSMIPLMSASHLDAGYWATFIGASFIVVVFILGAMAIQHPFNATLGPSWQQDRMLYLAVECGFLSMIVIAVISFAFLSMNAALVSLVVSLAGWLYFYMEYIRLSKRDAAMWLDAKPIVEPEGH